MDEMIIGSTVETLTASRVAASILDADIERSLSPMRAPARARRRPPRRNLATPEYRALEQIVAEAEAAGNLPVFLGPSGILEVRTPSEGCGIERGVLHRRARIDIEPASLG